MGHRVIAILFQTRGHPHLKRDLCRFVMTQISYIIRVSSQHTFLRDGGGKMIETLIALYIYIYTTRSEHFILLYHGSDYFYTFIIRNGFGTKLSVLGIGGIRCKNPCRC